MWSMIVIAALILTIGGLFYLWLKFQKFGLIRRIAGDKVWLRRLLGAVVLVLFGIGCLIDPINAIIVLLHLMVFWMVADLIALIVRRILRRVRKNKEEATAEEKTETKERAYRPYWLGIGVLLFSVIYLCIGWYLANHIWVTTYDLSTDKDLGQKTLKIAFFGDSHIGTTFDGEGFAKEMKRIQEEHPDLVMVVGDYVDDSTTKADMIRSCQALGELETTYGVYYVSGNHDRGYFNHRNFSYEEMVAELEKNNVHVMMDDVELVADSFYIIGRKDMSMRDRLDMEELTKSLDPDKYKIVLDHQPRDYTAQAASGVDLVLSGHTHGGQLIPINNVGVWLGVNDKTYGLETRGNTDFIVTSGISDWAIWFKTGAKSEYVVVNITGK